MFLIDSKVKSSTSLWNLFNTPNGNANCPVVRFYQLVNRMLFQPFGAIECISGRTQNVTALYRHLWPLWRLIGSVGPGCLAIKGDNEDNLKVFEWLPFACRIEGGDIVWVESAGVVVDALWAVAFVQRVKALHQQIVGVQFKKAFLNLLKIKVYEIVQFGFWKKELLVSVLQHWKQFFI